ncbi:NTD biosynthesis operon regulator NtdR [Alteripontixanthobacter maritimus]|uniref:NTD biosynthesis operon regulator NtdR n=1 Tax=Alteripontixanthobacter maritimus TaxID=2161824 RepID=A0A369Q2X3_9SPHN|nr:LacI family DNA-binding transcriptional regulator [Alteripontixanthobacter maritimus]RDC59114.1 NTD biosynthesis operon regulator NtdR [Alteripontixanthobacter maritimus]
MADKGNPTINDVARLAEVSKKTVSRVINNSPLLSEKTREHVQSVIADIGYVPNPQARALALRRNFIIAAVHDNPNAQFLVKVQQGVLEALEGTAFGLMVQPVDRESPTIAEDLRAFIERQRPYGIVLLPPISENDELAKVCRDAGCKYVRMASVALDEPDRMVTSNDREAVREAVSYIAGKGHKRIALIEGRSNSRSAIERRLGYEEALAAANLEVRTELIEQGGYTFESGMEAATKLLEAATRPTAIFASNDEMAVGALIAARRKGIEVPRGLSIAGFDDTPLSNHVWPPLTTVRWPISDMARIAACKLIAGPEDAPVAETLLPSVLVKRDSVGPPPQD